MTTLSVPKIAKYGEKKIAAITERTYVTALTVAQEISPGQAFEINPMMTGGGNLKCIYGPNSYGMFQVKIYGHASDNYLDGSSNCFFSKVSTNAGAYELETFNFMNVYMPWVYDYCCNPMTRNTFYTVFGNW